MSASEQHRERGRGPSRQDRLDKAVGSVATVPWMIVMLVSVPAPIKTGVLGMIGVLLGVVGYLLGTRRR